MKEALAERPRKGKGVERQVQRLREDLEQKRRMIAEVGEEDRALNRGR